MAKQDSEAYLQPSKRQPDVGGGEDEGAPGWMVTFADMMTLLLCFFVLLLSFANQDVQKFEEVLGSLKYAFGVRMEKKDESVYGNPSVMEGTETLKMDKDKQELLGLILLVRKEIRKDPDLENKAVVNAEPGGALLRIDSSAMFEPGSARLREEALGALDDLARILTERNFSLVVRGHTDDRPLGPGSQFASNWELSAARAAATLDRLLQVSGVSPNRLKAVGYADSRPLVPNTTPENRTQNRRVEFYFHYPTDIERW